MWSFACNSATMIFAFDGSHIAPSQHLLNFVFYDYMDRCNSLRWHILLLLLYLNWSSDRGHLAPLKCSKFFQRPADPIGEFT